MGQYYMLVNFDTKEMINPHTLGNGLKFREQIGWEYAFSAVTHYLVSKGMGRGGGDFPETALAGSWAGQRFALVGDYAEFEDFDFISEKEWEEYKVFRGKEKNSTMYRDSKGRFARGWTDISNYVASHFEGFYDIRYTGSGWMDITPVVATPQPKGYDEEIDGSSLVKHIKYDVKGLLQIEFHSNPGVFYFYTNVDTPTAMDFLYSASKGRFYHQFIKGKFPTK